MKMANIERARQPDRTDKVASWMAAVFILMIGVVYFAVIGYMAYQETKAPAWWKTFIEAVHKAKEPSG